MHIGIVDFIGVRAAASQVQKSNNTVVPDVGKEMIVMLIVVKSAKPFVNSASRIGPGSGEPRSGGSPLCHNMPGEVGLALGTRPWIIMMKME